MFHSCCIPIAFVNWILSQKKIPFTNRQEIDRASAFLAVLQKQDGIPLLHEPNLNKWTYAPFEFSNSRKKLRSCKKPLSPLQGFLNECAPSASLEFHGEVWSFLYCSLHKAFAHFCLPFYCAREPIDKPLCIVVDFSLFPANQIFALGGHSSGNSAAVQCSSCCNVLHSFERFRIRIGDVISASPEQRAPETFSGWCCRYFKYAFRNELG